MNRSASSLIKSVHKAIIQSNVLEFDRLCKTQKIWELQYLDGIECLEAENVLCRVANSPELLEIAIKSGADPNWGGCRPPIISAALGKNIDSIKILCSAGANPNLIDLFTGETALHVACITRPFDIDKTFHVVKYLVEIGADSGIKDDALRTPADVLNAERKNFMDLRDAGFPNRIPDLQNLADFLLKSTKTSALIDRWTLTPAQFRPSAFCSLSRGGNLPLVKDFIRRGFDVNSRLSKTGETALDSACLSGQIDVANELLNAGADPNLKVPGLFNRTPFLAVAESGSNPQTFVLLSKFGADVNAEDSLGRNAIDLFVKNNPHIYSLDERSKALDSVQGLEILLNLGVKIKFDLTKLIKSFPINVQKRLLKLV